MPRSYPAMLFALFAASAVYVAEASAHEPGLSTTVVRLHENRTEVVSVYNDADLRPVQMGGATDLPRAVDLKLDGRLAVPVDRRIEPRGAAHTALVLGYRTTGASRLGMVVRGLDRLPPGHKHYLEIVGRDGSTITSRILDAGSVGSESTIELSGSGVAAGSDFESAVVFARLGVEHIFAGIDHLLFLFVLLLGCMRLREALRLVTAFSIAHSITLGAAVLGLADLPAGVVEPAIAASILYVALAGLLRLRVGPETTTVAFVFGLVHGFGFASALGDLGVGADFEAVVVRLIAFNFGIEAGQAAIALVVLPLLVQLGRARVFARAGVATCSLAAVGVSAYWLIDRTILG